MKERILFVVLAVAAVMLVVALPAWSQCDTTKAAAAPAAAMSEGDMPAGDMPAGEMSKSDMPAGEMPEAAAAPAGEMPQDVYGLYIVAMRAGDLDKMAAYVTKEKMDQLQAMPDEQKKQIAEMMKMMAPVEYAVITEDIQGDTATLTLTGQATDFAGGLNDQKGTATFVKEDGVWKLVSDSWQVSSDE